MLVMKGCSLGYISLASFTATLAPCVGQNNMVMSRTNCRAIINKVNKSINTKCIRTSIRLALIKTLERDLTNSEHSSLGNR